MNYAQHVSTKSTPQTEAIPGKPMVENSAGGFSFSVDAWERLDRFLILGCEGGSYYANERKLTVDSAKSVKLCLALDGARVVRRIVEISEEGRAPKNDAAIFALALAASDPSHETKEAALAALPKVCRIGTHLFHFIEAVESQRGWGRGLRRAVSRWYTERDPKAVAYQCIKYQSRDGWSHRDLMRLCHLNRETFDKPSLRDIYQWVSKGWEGVGEEPHPDEALRMVWAFERAKRATTKEEICKLVRDYRLPRECIPTQWLNECSVWEALLEEMPLTALIRNIATMTRAGLLAPMSAGTGKVLAVLASGEKLRASRIHPVAVLAALLTYKAGHGMRGGNTWTPVSQVVDALDGAFYKAFGNVPSTGKRWLLALDVSGSMGGGTIAGVPGLSPRVGSCAMALVTAAVESQHHFMAFSSSLIPLTFSPRQRLDDVCAETARIPFGGTDCALPMLYAAERKIPVDVFVTYTDSESWAGAIHASQALVQYRQKMGISAKAICVGMVATEYTVLDPSDSGSLNVAGFDTSTPAAMSAFVGE